MTHDSSRSDGGGNVNRRRVLEATGAAAIGGAMLSGMASAHPDEEDELTEGPVFCGCSQVCACGTGRAEVIVAQENGDGLFECNSVPVEFDFCHEVSEGKIIAVEVTNDGETTIYCNPNENCAGDAIRHCVGIDNCDAFGEQGGPCGKPPCEHPGRGNGPPDGDGNGRDSDDGNGNGRGRGP